jgi:DNA polymerase
MAAFTPRQRQLLAALDLALWERRDLPSGAGAGSAAPALLPTIAAAPAPSGPAASEPERVATLPAADWTSLEQAALACTRCRLHQTRTRVVFGVGDRAARWMVIGEAPGADEDRQGEPFVGRAGQLLNEMLRAAGVDRGQVYIANVLKCRPPENRDPKPDETDSCEPYLKQQIELVQPRLLLAVGRIAAQALLRTETPIGRLRGQVHAYAPTGTPLVVTYHPAYLLRSPTQKRRAWEDLLLARSVALPG